MTTNRRGSSVMRSFANCRMARKGSAVFVVANGRPPADLSHARHPETLPARGGERPAQRLYAKQVWALAVLDPRAQQAGRPGRLQSASKSCLAITAGFAVLSRGDQSTWSVLTNG